MKLFSKKNFSSFISQLSSRRGFTLIELLIVIAILGILAAAVLVAINPGQRIASARNSRVRADLAAMGQSANVFNADTGLSTTCLGGGSYPSAFNQTACGATFMGGGAPVPPTSTYDYETVPAVCAPNSTTPCTVIAIAGPAYPDPNSTPAVVNTSSLWCWRSAAGTITLVADDAACAP